MPEGGRDYVRLKASIERIGLLDPIVLYENMILDGRSRYKICCKLGAKATKLRYTEFKGTPAQAVEFVFARNMTRKQLTEKQRHAASTLLAWSKDPELKNESYHTQAVKIAKSAEHGYDPNYSCRTIKYMVENPQDVTALLNGSINPDTTAWIRSIPDAMVKAKRLSKQLTMYKRKARKDRPAMMQDAAVVKAKRDKLKTELELKVATLENTLLKAANATLARKR
jgi:hypothetical protein